MNFDLNTLWSALNGGYKGLIVLVIVLLVIPNLKYIPTYTKAGVDWLSAQAKNVHNQYASGVLQRLSTMAGALVLAYENTAIEDLKTRASKGEITWEKLPELLAALKGELLKELKAHATATGLWQAALALFGGSEEAMQKWLDSIVEAHVAQLPPSNLQTGSSPAMAKSNPS